MKKLLLSVFTLTLILANAQQPNWCGTQISQEWMEEFYKRDISHLTHKSLNPVYLPITYYIVGQDNGAGYYTLNALFRSHCELQATYDSAQIYFYIKDIKYINNSYYYTGNETQDLFDYNNLNTINVYFVNAMDGVCGYSYVPVPWDSTGSEGPNRGGLVLANNCMQANNTTYRHEMGHYLNLPHTFYGWEGLPTPNPNVNAPEFTDNGAPVERADRSNCLRAGDGFCDTPPDYISSRWSCNSPRTFRDPIGEVFQVDPKNFMAYSDDNCAEYFKEDQMAEMNASPLKHRPYILVLPVPEMETLASVTSSFPVANATDVNSQNPTFSWNTIENADYYQIQVSANNFNTLTVDAIVEDTFYIHTSALSMNANYQYRIRPISFTNVCSDYATPVSFSTSAKRATVVTTTPVCGNGSDGTAQINITGGFTTATYTWYADLEATDQISVVSSNTMSDLSSGDYSAIVVVDNTTTIHVTFTIQEPTNALSVAINQDGNSLVANISGGVPPYTYSWQNGSTSLMLENPSIGENYLTAIDQNGCEIVKSFNFQLSDIGDIDILDQVVLFPNPLSGNQFTVTFNSAINNVTTLSVANISGQIVHTEKLNATVGSNSFTITDLSLAGGMYFVTLSSQGDKVTKKLVQVR